MATTEGALKARIGHQALVSHDVHGAPPPPSARRSRDLTGPAKTGAPLSPPLPSNRKLAPPKRREPGRLGKDFFVLWEKAGRSNTPVSDWKVNRDLYSQSKKFGKFLDGSTMRASVVGPARLPPSALEVCYEDDEGADIPTFFDGMWISRTDGDVRGRIERSSMMWEEDGSCTRLRFHKSNPHGGPGDLVTMRLDGEVHSGVLSEDGHMIKWLDGDHWMRVDQSYDLMQEYCATDPWPEDVQLQGWSFTDACIIDRNSKSISKSGTGSPPPSRPATSHQAARHRAASPERFRPSTGNRPSTANRPPTESRPHTTGRVCLLARTKTKLAF
jgi:hypothetical protein